MTGYVPPDPSVAEYVYRKNEELEAVRNRLRPMTDEELRTVLRNPDESTARQIAMGFLFMRLAESSGRNRDAMKQRVVELFGDFLDDPDTSIARMAIDRCPLMDEQHIQKVRRQLDSSDDHVKAEAAIALAKISDPTILAKLFGWFQGDNEGYRNVAIGGLKTLGTEEARVILVKAYEEGGRGEQDKAVLATALLRMGDTRGRGFLDDVAKRARGALSVMAATWIYAEHEADEGLRLMLHVLDNGDAEAKRSMVNQICYSFMHSPHAFTADGIHEARLWVERKLESPQKYGP